MAHLLASIKFAAGEYFLLLAILFHGFSTNIAHQLKFGYRKVVYACQSIDWSIHAGLFFLYFTFYITTMFVANQQVT